MVCNNNTHIELRDVLFIEFSFIAHNELWSFLLTQTEGRKIGVRNVTYSLNTYYYLLRQEGNE
jgi:hypothetical protein